MASETCKACDKPSLRKFIDFGQMPVANAYVREEDIRNPSFEEYTYNMAVGFCDVCNMVQLTETVPYDKYIIPDQIGNTKYAFFSSQSDVMKRHFAGLAEEVENKFLAGNVGRSYNRRVVEVGSNDGIMLQAFRDRESVLGIEPSSNVARVAQEKGIETIVDFFSQNLAEELADEKGKARAVLTANVFLNIYDIHDFMNGVNELLDDKGVFITEDPYLGSILEQGGYDQIYDEHVWYFSLSSLKNLYGRHGFEIIDAKPQTVHGGSMRVYASRSGTYPQMPRVKEILEQEEEKGLTALNPFLQFAETTKKNRDKLINLLAELKSQNKKIVGYAAASKGTIVHNFCSIGPDTLDYIADSTPAKQGLYTPGMHIPIVAPEVFRQDKDVDYAFLGAWNHAKEIMSKENAFINRGGKFITHMPEPHIIEP
jgi:methylation protein EvaC